MNRRELLRLVDRPGAAFLDGWSDEGRWTMALPRPMEEFRAGPGEEGRLEDFLRDAFDRFPADAAASRLPFSGGWVGFIGYEAGAEWEGARPRAEATPEPAAIFYRHESVAAVDPSGEPVGETPGADRREPENGSKAFEPSGEIEDSLPGENFVRAHAAIREGIARGDYYQVNLTRRFRVTTRGRGDGRDLFARLAGDPPPSYSALLRARDFDILSASPELFLRADFRSRTVEMRPIKGTARRFDDRERDEASARALLRSEKDRAENIMIVDLCRNDLGRVCEPGSVEVAELCRLRSHRVHHLESVVLGRLRPGTTPLGLLRSTFPPGSVTGAPKRAAVAAIRELEPVPRGVYCGAVGYLDCRGRVAFNVAIRTSVVTGSDIRYHAGGGITWDSEAEREREEGNVKAAEFLALLRQFSPRMEL
jgi:para-aminobenzoate synthetase component 1